MKAYIEIVKLPNDIITTSTVKSSGANTETGWNLINDLKNIFD